jgi:uncharacterized protein (DUF1810 family)
VQHLAEEEYESILMPSSLTDPFNLERFVAAQTAVYSWVCRELRGGKKQSHWMWFIFPQLKGLGRSRLATEYGIASRQEAEAYLRHPILGDRLRECTRLVTAIEDRTIEDIFGHPDDLKFHSSMTLFAHAAQENAVFNDALRKYYSGAHDAATLKLLSQPDNR